MKQRIFFKGGNTKRDTLFSFLPLQPSSLIPLALFSKMKQLSLSIFSEFTTSNTVLIS